MAKLIGPGDTIIGKHTDGHTRKWDWKGLKKHPVLNRNMTLYECSLNTYAEIVKVCEQEELSDECIEKYNHNLGDSVNADAISIYVDSNRKEKFNLEARISGRHKAQAFSFRNLSVCTISIPLRNLAKLLEQQKKIEQ